MRYFGFCIAVVFGFGLMTMWNEVNIVEEAEAVAPLEKTRLQLRFNIESLGIEEEAIFPIDFTQPGIRNGGVRDARLTEATLMKLYKAGELASKKGWQIKVISAKRSKDGQQYLYDCYRSFKKTGVCECRSCNIASRPVEEAPHVAGKAIDVCIDGICGMMRFKYNGKHPKMKQLQVLMAEAGFSRYCKEWWHFESETLSPACKPGKY